MTVQTSQPYTAADTSTNSAAQNNSSDNVDQNQFLQLLVAQIRYQDPTNPSDSTAFVTQLAQFSSLEQLIAIRGDLDSVTQGTSGSTSTTTQGGN